VDMFKDFTSRMEGRIAPHSSAQKQRLVNQAVQQMNKLRMKGRIAPHSSAQKQRLVN